MRRVTHKWVTSHMNVSRRVHMDGSCAVLSAAQLSLPVAWVPLLIWLNIPFILGSTVPQIIQNYQQVHTRVWRIHTHTQTQTHKWRCMHTHTHTNTQTQTHTLSLSLSLFLPLPLSLSRSLSLLLSRSLSLTHTHAHKHTLTHTHAHAHTHTHKLITRLHVRVF